MGLDGLSRPDQILGYLDPLAQMGRAEKAMKELQKGNKVPEDDVVQAASEQNNKDDRKPKNWHHGQEKDDSLEEDLKDLFAQQFNIMLDPTCSYRFWYNEVTNKFELVDVDTGKVLLALTLEAFRLANEKMHHEDTGMITDRSA